MDLSAGGTRSTGSGGARVCWELGKERAEVDGVGPQRLGQTAKNLCGHYDPQWQFFGEIFSIDLIDRVIWLSGGPGPIHADHPVF
jgi:hypothetical protein